MRGLAVIFRCINYMANSLGKVKMGTTECAGTVGVREQRSLCSGAVEIHRIKLCHARPHEETGTAHNPKSRRGASTRDLQRMSSYRIRYWFKAW